MMAHLAELWKELAGLGDNLSGLRLRRSVGLEMETLAEKIERYGSRRRWSASSRSRRTCTPALLEKPGELEARAADARMVKAQCRWS